jgi:hypothetical protein
LRSRWRFGKQNRGVATRSDYVITVTFCGHEYLRASKRRAWLTRGQMGLTKVALRAASPAHSDRTLAIATQVDIRPQIASSC